MSVDILLKELDLEKYLNDFVEADVDMLESHAHREDEEVEELLNTVERVNKFKFPYTQRIKLWKALRYRWFRAPEFAKSFVHHAEVPELILPKKDYRIRDNQIEMKNLDSERQRMISRKAVFDEIEGTTVIQEDIYKRQSPLFYELTGLERTIEFWMSQDPRKMSREDPREEVFLNQMKMLELRIAALIDRFKIKNKIKTLVYRVFLVVRMMFLGLAGLFLAVAIVNASGSTSSTPAMEIFLSTSYIRCAALYLCTFFFVSEITKKRNKFSHFEKAKKMHAKCRFMHNDMISFRLKTHHVRLHRLQRYLDDSKLIDDPTGNTAVDTAIQRRPGLMVSNSAYDEYIGTGNLSSAALDIIKQTENINDLPLGRTRLDMVVDAVVLPVEDDVGSEGESIG